jgi:DNA invertase Pin-like site-specific DNA recombinase
VGKGGVEMTTPEPIPAVLYLRMSNSKQEKSIPDQRRDLIELADKEGFKILREYADHGISGDNTEKRKAFLKMRNDAALGDFEAILCWDASRFGRFDSIDAGH